MEATVVNFENLYQQQDATNNATSASKTHTPPELPPPSYGDIPGFVPFRQGSSVGPPPTYEEANNPNAPPPTYESLFGRVRQARKNSSGFLDFLKRLLILLLGTLGCTIIVGVTVVIPVTMIIIGSAYIYDCPAEPYIPVYLIVGGVFGVIKNLMNFWSRCKKRDSEEEPSLKQNPLETVINCFLFAWFITGCVWVYRVYEPDFNDESKTNYCDPTLYLFAFWLITAVYIVLGLLTMCLCCIGVASLTIRPE